MTRPQVDHPDGGEGDAFYVVAFVKPLLMGVRTHPARQGRFFAVTRCVTIRDNPPPGSSCACRTRWRLLWRQAIQAP